MIIQNEMTNFVRTPPFRDFSKKFLNIGLIGALGLHNERFPATITDATENRLRLSTLLGEGDGKWLFGVQPGFAMHVP